LIRRDSTFVISNHSLRACGTFGVIDFTTLKQKKYTIYIFFKHPSPLNAYGRS
jgi:hypothetical protein